MSKTGLPPGIHWAFVYRSQRSARLIPRVAGLRETGAHPAHTPAWPAVSQLWSASQVTMLRYPVLARVRAFRSELGHIQLAQRTLGLSPPAQIPLAILSIFPISRLVWLLLNLSL